MNLNQDKCVFNTIQNALKRARTAALKAQAAEQNVFELLQAADIDPLEVPTGAENADNLAEAITCHLSYGEYTIPKIMKEIRGAYGMGEREDG